MRSVTIVCVVVALAGCKASEQCSPATSCANGSYQACTDGTQCRYLTSDGKSFACGSCGDCQGAVGAAVSWCGGGVGGNGNGNGSNGSVSETQACMDYLSCVTAVTPAQLPTLIATYGPSGTCWLSATMASACDSACMMALAQLRSTPNLPAACGGSGGSGGGGGGGAGGGGGGGGGVVPGDMAMPRTYQMTTVAQMRGTHVSGDYEVDGVVAIGLTPSTTSPRLFFQDVGGGDFSAMMARCSTGSQTHPCTVASTIATIAEGQTLTLQGTYLRNNAGLEDFYVDAVRVLGTHALPAAATAQLADVQRNANTAKLWFQRVRVDLGATTLKMFDFSPPEMKFTSPNGAVCPAYFGWGMVPSTSPDTVGGACMGTTQPPSAVVGTAPSDEVILDTDFYRSFTYSADCACAAGVQATLLTASSVVTNSVGGILIADIPFQQTALYQYLAPKSSADALLH